MTSERRTAGEGFAPTATGQSPSRLVRWSAGEMVLALGLAVAAILGSRALYRWATAEDAAHRIVADETARWFICSTLLNAVFLLVPLGLLFFRHRKPLLSTLIPGNRLDHDFGWGLSLGLLVAALNAISVQRAVAHGMDVGHPAYYQLVYQIGAKDPGDVMRPLLLFAVSWGLFSPVAEEVFFRGFLFAAIRRQTRAPLAAMISALIFALFHYPHMEPMAAAFILGLVVAVVYEYSGSLLAPIMTHMGLNLAFVLGMANHGELAKRIPPWVFYAAGVVFVLHFFLSSRYLFRKPR